MRPDGATKIEITVGTSRRPLKWNSPLRGGGGKQKIGDVLDVIESGPVKNGQIHRIDAGYLVKPNPQQAKWVVPEPKPKTKKTAKKRG